MFTKADVIPVFWLYGYRI